MENKNLNSILINANLTDTCYFDSKTFYYDCFGSLAHVSAIHQVDYQKAAAEIKTAFADKIDEIYIHRTYDGSHAYRVIVVMKEAVIVELGSTYAEILHGADNMELVEALTQFILAFKPGQKRRNRELSSKHSLRSRLRIFHGNMGLIRPSKGR